MFIWPDGDVTGSIRWNELETVVATRSDKTVTEAGYEALEVLVRQHHQAVSLPEPDEPAPAAGESEPEPVLEDEPVEPVRRGRRAARPEEE